jgi:N-acetylmuramoyl-L-alanine amidase
VTGARERGAAGGAALRRAAELRTRLWRLEHKETDALEAIELYKAAGELDWPGACDATIHGAVLEGELRGDPSLTYRSVYGVRKAAKGSGCTASADRVLDSLTAYRPLPAVLRELDARATKTPSAPAPALDKNASNGVVVPQVDPSAKEAARITGIERYGAKEAARIVVSITRPTLFSVGSLAASDTQGPRLFVDIDNATYKGPTALPVGGVVQRVRLGPQKNATRLVLDLQKEVFRSVFYLPEPFRLIVDVTTHPPEQAAPRGPRKLRRVVLDPGHGGYDPGATGPSGLREKDVTLDIATRAAPLINHELDITTRLTRDGDEYVPLEKRTQIANDFHADLFISIHCNASEDGVGNGVMTFVLDASHDALASRIAALENSASPAAAAEIANTMSQVQSAGSVAESVHFAQLLQRAALASLAPYYGDVPDRGVKRAGFYVLVGARMPAALFETSFISNPTGDMRLNTADYRQKMADAIVNAIRAYRDGR